MEEKIDVDKIEFIEDMKVLELKENDILVIKSKSFLTEEAFRKIKQQVKENLPENIKDKTKIFILDPGIDIGIIRKEG